MLGPCAQDSNGKPSWAAFLSLTSRTWFGEDIQEEHKVRLDAALLATASFDDSNARTGKAERVAMWLYDNCTSANANEPQESVVSSPSSPVCKATPFIQPPQSQTQTRHARASHGQSRRSSRGSRSSSSDFRLCSCQHASDAAYTHSHSPLFTCHKRESSRPMMIPEMDDEDECDGALRVVSATTCRSSSRLCELEKLLSFESDGSRASQGTAVTKSDVSTVDSHLAMYTPFSETGPPGHSRARPNLSPVPSCEYLPSSCSTSLRDTVGSGMRKSHSSAGADVAAISPQLQMQPQWARGALLVDSPRQASAMVRASTCHTGSRGVDIAAAMETALLNVQLHMSSSAELARRCLPSVTLTTTEFAPAAKRSSFVQSRIGSCPGPAPCKIWPVQREGRRVILAD